MKYRGFGGSKTVSRLLRCDWQPDPQEKKVNDSDDSKRHEEN